MYFFFFCRPTTNHPGNVVLRYVGEEESTDHNNNITMTNEDLLQPGNIIKERWKVVSRCKKTSYFSCNHQYISLLFLYVHLLHALVQMKSIEPRALAKRVVLFIAQFFSSLFNSRCGNSFLITFFCLVALSPQKVQAAPLQ